MSRETVTRSGVVLVVAALGIMVVLAKLGLLLAPGAKPVLLTPDVPLVRSAVAAVMICGAPGDGFNQAVEAAPNARGTWSHEQQGDCVVWFRHPASGAD